MNERLPYDENLKNKLEQLPVPSENEAWKKMKLLLEEEDDDRIIPPLFLRGCLIGMGFLLLIGLGVWWLTASDSFTKKEHVTNSEKLNRDTNSSQQSKEILNNNNVADSSKTPVNKIKAGNEAHIKKPALTNKSKTLVKGKKTEKTYKLTPNLGLITKAKKSSSKQVSSNKPEKAIVEDQNIQNNVTNTIVNTNPSIDEKPKNISATPDSVKLDSTTSIQSDTSFSKVDSAYKATKSKTKKFQYSAGVALQQQIPFNGQKVTPYNYYGRKSSLGDYIPSVYFRMHKDDLWFIHAEFRYGAPQYTKEFVYNIKIVDSLGASTIQTEYKLRKTFYHQLNLSFNYKIKQNWYLGLGTQYAKFYGAIADAELRRKNIATQEDVLLDSKTMQISGAASDSFFRRSHFNILAETQYQYKKFSFGLRYVKGLQPYITYFSNGSLRSERNFSMQLFVRYQIWKSKKK